MRATAATTDNRPDGLSVFDVVVVAIFAAVICGASWRIYGPQDFVGLYDSASDWLRTGSWVRTGGHPATVTVGTNLNLPHTTILLVPFGLLPLLPAWVCWQAVNFLCLGIVIWRGRSLVTFPLLLLLVVTPALLTQVVCGQVAGILALFVDSAWRADRSQRSAVAGFWLGCAIAMKPFLLPLAAWWVVRCQWRATAVAAVTIVAIICVGTAVFGAAAYVEWSRVLGQVDWYEIEANASLLGAVQRSGVAAGLEQPLWLCASGAVALATGLATWRTTDTDRAWTLLLLASLLISPLGWTYYELIIIATLLQVVRSIDWVRQACLLAWIPPGIPPASWSISTVALMMVWATVLLNTRTSREPIGGDRTSNAPML